MTNRAFGVKTGASRLPHSYLYINSVLSDLLVVEILHLYTYKCIFAKHELY